MNISRISAVVCVLSLASILCAEETENGKITKVASTKTKSTVEGVCGQDWELVMRIGKASDVNSLEWVSGHKDQQSFVLTIEYGKIVPLGNNQLGEGLVHTITFGDGNKGVTNIAFSDTGRVRSGIMKFRTGEDNKTGKIPIEEDGLKVTIADLVHDDGSLAPVTIFLRPR